MKKKGFTLIELLAVIVILAVIAIIAIPIITNVIDKAKQGALKDSAYGILDSAEMYLAKNMNKGIDDTMEFTCNNGKCLSGTEEIDYKGKIESGKVRIYADSKIELCVTDNKSSALKTVANKKVTVETGTCNYGELNYGVTALVSKEVLDAKQNELDEANEKYNNLKGLVDQTDAIESDIALNKKVVTSNGLITGISKSSDKIFTGSGSIGNGDDTKVKMITIQNDGKFFLTGTLTNVCYNNNGAIRIYVNDTIIWNGSITTTSQSSAQKISVSADVKAGDIIYYNCCCVIHLGNASLYYDYYIIGN